MMAGTKDIKDFTKYPSLSDTDYLLGTKTDLGGTDAGITVAAFRKQVAQDVKPTVKNGYWWVDGVNTGVVAEVKNPVFRYTSWGLEYKLQGQDDAAFQKLIPLADIKFDWEDLTPEQKAELKGEQGLSAYQVWLSVAGNAGKTLDEYLSWLRQPATDAAARADDKLAQLSQEVSQELTNMRQLEATVEDQEAERETFYSQTKAAEQGRQNDELKRKEEETKRATAEVTRDFKETERNTKFAEKVQEAEEATAEAKSQGDYAKEEGDKAAGLTTRVDLLEIGKADNLLEEDGKFYLTSGGVVISDGIEFGKGGGGSGSGGVTMKVKNLVSSLLSAIQGQELQIGYNFTSVYTDDNTPTGTGTAVYTINSQKVATITVNQGDNYFEVSKYLTIGTNKMSVKISDSTGASRSLTYVIDVISLSISDSYIDTQINTAAITYRYTPVGAIEKTIHFILDGTALESVVTTISNRQQTYNIPAQKHGAHRLEVYMTALVNDIEVRSNTLIHDLICTEAENNTVIVASSFNHTIAKQYDKLVIPFIVYNPVLSTSPVILSVNNIVLSEQTVGRTLQIWNYRLSQSGNVVLKIASGEISKIFALTVSEAEEIVEAETADLELFLTSQNRSNNDNNKSEWKYNTIAASLTNFNYRTDGWITTDGSTALHVSGDARVTIPFNVFASDFRSTGKTIEFEFSTRDVVDYDATVISCFSGNIGLKVTAQQALFKSEQTSVDTRFKEDEKVRVSFVIEKRTDYRLVYIYINGIMSGVAQYSADDNFQQASPVGIVIGSKDCTVDIYNIRIYHNNLTQYQVLDNYMADMDDYDRKMEVYERNQVFDEYGNISYQKVVTQIPCMILEGPLPTFKGDKRTNKVLFTNLQEPARDFSCETIQNDVQGTSSQYYPRKNFKFKFKATITYTESGEANANYALRSGSIPVNCFCIKADFAESSGTHNTGLAKVIEGLLKSMNILTPAQKANNQVRTTVDGYPICLFHRESPDAELSFVGKYNFNNDKSTETTFGFTDGDESWEFLNNTSDRSLFKSADFSTSDWQNDFEARYPDGGTDTTNLQPLMAWVVSTIGNTTKFKAEVADHFDLRNLLSYYLITELFGMVDQRAKNMFLTRFAADGKWRFIFYDNDTCNGINNEGLIAFDYGIEYHDTEGTLSVFNGEQSVLWNNVEAAFGNELADMYREMRTHLSYASVTSVLNGEQSEKWCEAIYNADGRYKYINPLIEEGNGSYLYAAQGSREEHRKWWLFSRFLYMDSKYNAADFLTDYATMRLYTPQNWTGVEPNADFTITPFADQYVRVKYGSYILAERCKKDVPVTIQAPAITFNDTETIVYGASRIKSLGNLSGKYAGTIDMSKAVRLSELHIGSDVEGYHNDNLTVLSVGSNRMLRKLDVQNCPNLRQPVDVSGCENIEELYAKGTSITTAVFAPAGILKKLQLPNTVTNLTLKNQSKLTDENFTLVGVNSLTTIVLENVVLNVFALLLRSLNGGALQRIRMINVSGSAETADILYQIAGIGGIDENGYNIDRAVLTGNFHVTTIREDKFAELSELFPELTITYDTLTLLPAVTLSFSSSLNKPLLLTKFVCSSYFKKIDNTTFEVKGLLNSKFTFTFSALNHVDVTGEVTITQQEATKEYTATYIPLRTIKILKRNTTIFIPNATVKIGDETYTANAVGQVQIRKEVSLAGTVEATDYNDNSFEFEAIVDDTTNTVYLDPCAVVTFSVKDENNVLLSGATVTVGSKSATTNSSGVCTIALKTGDYNYTAKYGNYAAKGKITVVLSNLSENVVVVLDIELMAPEPNGNIQMMLTGTTGTLNITSNTSNYSINWGDGETTLAAGAGTKTYSHIYTQDAEYQVEVLNCSEVISCSGISACLAAYWSVGNSKVSGLHFENYYKLKFVGSVFINDSERTSFKKCFNSCRGLLKLKDSMFCDCPLATDFSYCFEYCYFTEIPSVLFDYCPLAMNFNSCFSETYYLKAIPSGLFKNNSAATDFSYCFGDTYGTYNVYSYPIPSGLFDNCPEALYFNNCFGLNGAITSIPAGLFDRCTKAISFSGCFMGNRQIRNISEDLFKYNTKAKYFASCFARTGISTVSETLFAYCPEVENFGSIGFGSGGSGTCGCFGECDNLKSIPADIFSNNPLVTSFMACFKGFSGTSIPENIFANNPLVTDFRSCFYKSSITVIPGNIFANNPLVTDFYQCFGYCAIYSIPSNLFLHNILATNFTSCFGSCVKLIEYPKTLFDNNTLATSTDSIFSDCSILRKAVIPTSFISMFFVYYKCKSLMYVISNSITPQLINSYTFNNTNNCPIYVPDESVDTYKTATNWSALTDRIKPMSDFSIDFPDEILEEITA